MIQAYVAYDSVNWPKSVKCRRMMRPRHWCHAYRMRPACEFDVKRPTIKRHALHWCFAFWWVKLLVSFSFRNIIRYFRLLDVSAVVHCKLPIPIGTRAEWDGIGTAVELHIHLFHVDVGGHLSIIDRRSLHTIQISCGAVLHCRCGKLHEIDPNRDDASSPTFLTVSRWWSHMTMFKAPKCPKALC